MCAVAPAGRQHATLARRALLAGRRASRSRSACPPAARRTAPRRRRSLVVRPQRLRTRNVGRGWCSLSLPPGSSRVLPGIWTRVWSAAQSHGQQRRAQEAGLASRGAPKPARSTCGRRRRGRADWPQARSARPKRARPSGRPRTIGRCAWAAKGSALGDLGRAVGRRRGPSSAPRRRGRSTRAAALCRRAGPWSGGAAAWAAESKGPFDRCCELRQCGRAGAHIQEPKRGGGVLRRHCAREVRRALVARRRIERAAAHGGQPAAGRWGWGWG